MNVGIDFDNTIICYHGVFRAAALEWGILEPQSTLVGKTEIRDHFRRLDREDDWTRLQGYVYGRCLEQAQPFPGVFAVIGALRTAGHEVRIISHKTKTPCLGPEYDLHQAAWDWLATQGCFAGPQALPTERVFFELTKDAKLGRIGAERCTHFIDDLPEFLAEPAFPVGVERICFDPDGDYPDERRFRRLTDWSNIRAVLLDGAHG